MGFRGSENGGQGNKVTIANRLVEAMVVFARSATSVRALLKSIAFVSCVFVRTRWTLK